MDNKKYGIVDNDFFNYLLRGKCADGVLFEKLIKELHVIPIVHEFVFFHEMIGNAKAREFAENGLLKVAKYEEFLKEPVMRSYYSDLFLDMYLYMNGKSPNGNPEHFNAMTYREGKANLGEIHSILLAAFKGYDLFMSNDNGAKKLAEQKMNTPTYSLRVQNVIEIFRTIALNPDSSITKKEFEKLTKGDKSRKTKIDEIRRIWID